MVTALSILYNPPRSDTVVSQSLLAHQGYAGARSKQFRIRNYLISITSIHRNPLYPPLPYLVVLGKKSVEVSTHIPCGFDILEYSCIKATVISVHLQIYSHR